MATHRRHSRQPAGGLRAGGRTARARETARRRCFRRRRWSRLCERMGITVPQTGSNSASNMQVKNMAAVFVVATLPPFSRPGYKVDITVSSAGDARSLEGGILLMTPLYGPDGQIYAQAQGALVLGGYMASGGGNAQADESSHHGAHSRRSAGGAAGALRPEADAHRQRGAERRRFSYRGADGGGHRPGAGRGAGARRRQPRVEIATQPERGCRGAARQGGGGRDRCLSAGAGGGERAHRDGGDRRHGAAAAGFDPAWRAERECDLADSRSRSRTRCLRERPRWCSRPRCRPRTSR